MKKIYTCILMIVCAMMFAGCQKDFMGVFTAEIEDYDGGDGKVYIDGYNYACWQNGDGVLINGNPCNVTIESGNTEAKIVMNENQSDSNFTAVYPAAYASGYSQYNYTITLPQMQTYEEKDGKQVVKAPMMAYTTAENPRLVFKNVASLLAVKVKCEQGTKSVRCVQVKVNEGKKLWGETTCTWANNIPTLGSLSNGGNMVTLEVPATLGTVAVNKEKTFYVVIPPVDANANFEVKVIYEEYESSNKRVKYYLKKSPNNPSLSCNKILPITMDNTTASNPYKWSGSGSENDPYLIASAVDMEILAKNKYNTADKYFKQIADIALPTDWIGIGTFYSHYNGDGHMIINNATEHSVFNMAKNAEIKNVKVIVNARLEGVNSESYFGGLVSDGETITLDNCHVSGSITTSENNKKIFVGGICGRVSGNNNITNCSNSATITASRKSNVGGICGYVKQGNGTINITNCSNRAPITARAYVGGLVGNVYENLNIKNCMNIKKITSSGGSVGGFVGSVDGHSVTIENSCSYGGVEDKNHTYSRGGLIGCTAGRLTLNNVCVGDGMLTRSQWISGHIAPAANNAFNCVYIPDEIDTPGVTKYTSDPNGQLMVGGITLLQALKNNATNHTDWIDWKDGTEIQPELNLNN